MGLAASQGRLLGITARMSDVEFSTQQLCQARIILAMKTEEMTNIYLASLSKTKMVGLTGFNNSEAIYSKLNFDTLTGPNSPLAGDYCLADASNRVLVTKEMASNYDGKSLDEFLTSSGAGDKSSANYQYYTNMYNRMSTGYTTQADESNTLSNSDWISNQLKNGGLYLEKFGTDGVAKDQDISASSEISEVSDDSDEAAAKAKYDAQMTAIQAKDKKLELQVKNLETEHTALQTEYESVKKVIDKNIENSFKTFG